MADFLGRWISVWVAFFALVEFTFAAPVDIDLNARQPIRSELQNVAYSASIADCTVLASIEAG